MSRWSASSKPGVPVGLRLRRHDRRARGTGTTSRGRSPSPARSSRPGSRASKRVELPDGAAAALPWSSPVMTTAACSPRGRYQKRGIGMTSSDICVIRFASSRCCSSACGMRMFAKSSQFADEQVARARPAGCRRPRSRPSAGLPWRVSTTERARSYANEAACPPAVPTSRSVTAADPVGRLRAVEERRDGARAAARPAVRGAVELQGRAGDAPAGRRARVDPEVPLGHVAAVRPQAEQRGEPRVRPHRDQVAAALHPGAEGGGLGVAQRGLPEHHDAIRGELLRVERARARDGERVQALGAQDLRVVAAEAARRPRRAPGRPDRSRAPGRQRVRRWRARRRHRRARCGDGSPCADNGASRAAFARRSATGSFCYAGKAPYASRTASACSRVSTTSRHCGSPAISNTMRV